MADEKEHIFVYIEDDPGSRRIVNLIMTTVLKYKHLTILEDSNNYLEKIKALEPVPTVFFLDIHVKPIEGYEILKALKADDKFKGAKFIAMTASVMVDEIKQLQDAGFDGLISKPIRKNKFAEQLEKLLAGEALWVVS